MLLPNNKQRTKLFECAGVARFAYNWALSYEKFNYYEIGNDFLSHNELRKIFTQLKSKEEYAWLKQYSNNIAKQAIIDACAAYQNFFKGHTCYPHYKSKKKSRPSFYVDTAKIRFTDTHLKLEKLSDSKKPNRQKFNFIRLAEPGKIPVNAKYFNPRVTFDGQNWWISVGIEYSDPQEAPQNEGIGIDVGIQNLATCSDGPIYQNINKTRTVRNLCKRKKHLQRKLKKKMKGGRCCKTQNAKKCEKQLWKVNQKLTNIRLDHLHQTTTDIVKRKPSFVVLEDLNDRGLLRNKHFADACFQQWLSEFYRQMGYKCRWNLIEFVIAEYPYPSDRMCCTCGHIQQNPKIADQTYICESCGSVIDRSYQVSINLKKYGDLIAKPLSVQEYVPIR